MKKGCELCGKLARMYCDSDQAILCWDCDERVHCANFLVAKHSRCLLCHVCQSPTPWKASGTKFGPTVSVCESCSNSYKGAQTSRRHQEDEEMESFVGEDSDDGSEAESDEDCSDSGDYNEDDDDDGDSAAEEDGENQVVPWSPSAIPSSSAPPVTTSSCSEQGSLSTRDGGEAVSSALKRFRHNPYLDSDDEDGCCSPQVDSKTAAMKDNGASFRALEMARTEEYSRAMGETESRKLRRMEILSSLMRFQQRTVCSEHNASKIIRGISKLSRDI